MLTDVKANNDAVTMLMRKFGGEAVGAGAKECGLLLVGEEQTWRRGSVVTGTRRGRQRTSEVSAAGGMCL